MLESLFMLDACLLALAKNALDWTNINIFNKFQDLWYNISKFLDEIMTYIQQTVIKPELLSGIYLNSSILFRPEQRAMLKAVKASKKL